MSAKQILFGEGAHARLVKGMNTLADAGWISREPGSRPALTDEGREILAALDRANGEGQGATEIGLHLIDEDLELNPRTTFDEEELAALAASIGDKGVVQPVLLRPSPEPGRYRVVAGARRIRASRLAAQFTIPAIVRDLADDQALEIATIENVQLQSAIDTNVGDHKVVQFTILADMRGAGR